MSMQKLTGALGVLVLLSACSVGPNFKTPAPPRVDAYTSKNDAVPLAKRIELGKRIETDWWALFASKALNGVVRQVVDNNNDLTSAKETLAQAEEAVKAESGSLLPQASLGAIAGRQKYGAALFGPANFSIPPFTYYELGPSVSWTPDFFGGEHRAVERQQALANYQAHEVDAMYVTLTGDTVAAALDMAAANAEMAALGKVIAEDETIRQLVQSAYEAGSATKMDILSAQSQLNSDQAMLPSLKQRLSISRHALSIFVGKAPANWVPPDFQLSDFTLPQALPVSLPAELVKKRPDILAAEANLHAASAGVGVATANLYPQLTLSANMMQEALTPAGIFSLTNNAWSLAAGLSAPIFNGGTLSAQKRGAEHAYQASLAQYRQTILVAFRQVADALTSLAHDDEEIVTMTNAVNTASASLDLSRASYQAGAIGLLQTQDAQRTEAKAQLDMIRAQHERDLDCVRLFVALGGSPIKAQ
jgi:NodT family efflux transporter outer membrane factor (OMF) lipoprotein